MVARFPSPVILPVQPPPTEQAAAPEMMWSPQVHSVRELQPPSAVEQQLPALDVLATLASARGP